MREVADAFLAGQREMKEATLILIQRAMKRARKKAATNDGRQSDFAFGALTALERLEQQLSK